jgi:hypothetical protein
VVDVRPDDSAIKKLVYVTLPMMRTIIAITALFSLIVTFANCGHRPGPHRRRSAQQDAPTGDLRVPARDRVGGHPARRASVSLVMLPILAVFATFILRGVRQRLLTAGIVTTLIKGDVPVGQHHGGRADGRGAAGRHLRLPDRRLPLIRDSRHLRRAADQRVARGAVPGGTARKGPAGGWVERRVGGARAP